MWTAPLKESKFTWLYSCEGVFNILNNVDWCYLKFYQLCLGWGRTHKNRLLVCSPFLVTALNSGVARKFHSSRPVHKPAVSPSPPKLCWPISNLSHSVIGGSPAHVGCVPQIDWLQHPYWRMVENCEYIWNLVSWSISNSGECVLQYSVLCVGKKCTVPFSLYSVMCASQ